MSRGQEEAARSGKAAGDSASTSAFSERQWRMLGEFSYRAALVETTEAVVAALMEVIASDAEIAFAVLYELEQQQAVLRQAVRWQVNARLSPPRINWLHDPTPWRLGSVVQTRQAAWIPDWNLEATSTGAATGNAIGTAAMVLPLEPTGPTPSLVLILGLPAADAAQAEQSRQFGGQLAERVNAILSAVHQREAQQYRLQHEAEEVYASLDRILASMSDVFVMLDRDWRYIYVNDKALTSSGFSRAYLLGRSFWEVFPDLVNTPFAAQLQRALDEQQMVHFEYYYAPWDRWFENRVYPSARGISLFSIDITERKHAEEVMRSSQERLALASQAANIGTFEWNVQTNEVIWSPEEEALYGLPPGGFGGRYENWKQAVHPDDRYQAEQEVLQAVNQGSDFISEFRIIKPDGSIRWIAARGRVFCDGHGRPKRMIGVNEDVTERKHAEAAQRLLTEASALLMTSLDYQTTLKNIARLVVPTLADYCYFDIVGADGQTQRIAWQHCNPERRAWFDRIQQFVPPSSFQAHPAAAVLASGQPQLVAVTSEAWMESIAISPEHLQFMQEAELCSLMTVPLIARDRHLGVLTCCFTHESNRHYGTAELQLAEELTRRAALALDNADLYRQAQEANRIKDEFLAVLSHELRSPLNPILGWTRLLQTRQFDAATTARALQTIERNAKLQTQLIEDLLDISRILRGKMALTIVPVDLASIIEAAVDTVQLAADAKGIEICKQLDPVGQVAGDAARLQQVTWNLLSNAIKFTANGGRIGIQLEQVESPEAIPASSNSSPPYAQVTVSDTGKGIRPEFLPHVFEYFRQEDGKTTRQFGGLGLGLAIVRYLIELHGGTVWAESPGEGRGATFRFRLPILPEAGPVAMTTNAAEQDSEAAHQLNGVRILVVDDETDMRELMTVVLHQQGATVHTAASAAEALEALAVFQPDLLISDIGMPVMDGYRLMQQIRCRPPHQQGRIPAIALTAYAAETDQQQAQRAGFQKHIAKPVDPRDLIAAILGLLDQENR
ncbi:MAG: response regulator [Synechococcales cyanobacterium M58_A2018_015]|nr:response regulator [Synechococcales cyanobacterium M58_A2018_015]